jgi:Zn-dependent protease with chaperone function/WD40 repeat protein
MRKSNIFATLALAVTAICCVARAQAQQNCPVPPSVSAATGENMFLPQQESQLGSLMAEQMDHRYKILEAPELTAHMERVAGRILAQLPPTGLQFQFYLIDTPIVDAFSSAGGRIYVTRKMAAFLRNDDELAGLLAHEIGHIVTHQPAIEMTMLFQQVLGVHQVSTREDIAAKYNQLLDNSFRASGAYRKLAREVEPDQLVADRVAVYATATAGYSPQAVLQFFDRLAQTHGKTGGLFSDWFGLTTPAEKRLREMRKELAAMPAKCAAASASSPSAEFQKWQTDVVGYSGVSHKENLPGLLTRQRLDPPLREDITHLRFSPDGRYALAQDESSIFVLTHQPFAFSFRIDAPEAQFASFTPDSQNIVFSTRGLRVENWSVADQNRVSVHEMVVEDGCFQSRLSPDGKTLACLTQRTNSSGIVPVPYLDLQIFDVATGESIFTKKQFLAPNFENAILLLLLAIRDSGEFNFMPMAFSPDGRYLVAASRNATLALNIGTRATVPLHGMLNDLLKDGFAFMDSDRVVVENGSNPAKSAILKFPSGDMIKPIVLGNQSLDSTTQGNYVLLRPVTDALVGVMDWKTSRGVLALTRTPAVDIYDQQYLAQMSSGQVVLFNMATMKSDAQVDLPVSPLGSLRVQSVSPDFHWLALSGGTRGAVWDLSSMKRMIFARGFRGAAIDGNSALYADFPKDRDVARMIGRADFSSQRITPAVSLGPDSRARQHGPYLMTLKPNRKDKSTDQDVTMEVADARDGKILWTMNFPKEVPDSTFISDENRVILEWNAQTDAARVEIKKNEILGKQFSAMKDHSGVYLEMVLDAGTGRSLGNILIDTGNSSFRLENSYSSGDWLLVGDDQNRTLVYSIGDSALKGTVFGKRSILSPSAGLFATENQEGQLQIYSLPGLAKRADIRFSSPISMDRFSADGKKLFVLTKNQDFYVFDAAALGQSGQIVSK